MRYIKIKCVTEGCPERGREQTLPAGRPAAHGVMELLGNLECERCGRGMMVERAT
jgi:hypothetical protein